MHRPLLVRALLCAIVIPALVGCGGVVGAGDPLVELAARVPAAVADDGLLLRRGVTGNELLSTTLGLDAGVIGASATTPAPATRVLLTDGAGVTGMLDTLDAAGYVVVEEPAEGWQVLTPAEGVAPLLGVPAVALGPDIVAVADHDRLRLLAGGGEPLDTGGVLADADQALIAPAAAIQQDSTATGFAGGLPPFTSAVLTARGDVGTLALVLPGEGSQEDAVALAVRVRTEGPLADEGAPVFTPETALTMDEAVVVDVSWSADPARTLREGLDGRLLAFLGD